jgi:hypothetical protein
MEDNACKRNTCSGKACNIKARNGISYNGMDCKGINIVIARHIREIHIHVMCVRARNLRTCR